MTALRCTSRLPHRWPNARGLIAQGDLRINGGRLRAKCVVFSTPKNLRKFWKRISVHDLGRHCQGAVNGLCQEVIRISPKRGSRPQITRSHIETDRRYFCVIGLCRDFLTMRILSHEAVHAGFAYAKRRTRNPWDAMARQFDEEAIAYPTGEIARAMVCFLERNGLLKTAS